MLAQSYEQAEQFEKAEQIYADLLKQQNQNYAFFEALNRIMVRQKKYAESVSLLKNRITNNPQDVNSYGLLGSTYFMMDELENAYSVWEKGIAINPANVVSYRVIANFAIENRAFDKAIDILKRGKEYSTDPFIFSLDLANIYSVNMRFEDAAEEYCNLLLARPDQVGMIKSRIASYLPRQGAIEPTLRTIEKFAEKNPIPQMLDLLVFIYTSADKYDDALPTAIEYNKQIKSSGDYVFVFAQDAFRNQKFDVAAKAYEYVIENYPASQLIPIAKIGYANTIAESVVQKYSYNQESWKPLYNKKVLHEEEYFNVIKAYERLAKEFPNNAIYPQAVFKMAKIYSDHLLNYHSADSLFKLIMEKHSTSEYASQAGIALGKISITFNKLDEAQKYFRNSTALRIKSPNEIAEANFYLAKIEFWKGNFSKAITLFKDVTKDLSTNFANDALEISSLINISKRDSINLFRYAQADLYSFQNKFKEAANEYKTLADNPNLFIINEFVNLKFAEMLLANDELPEAIKVLEILYDDTKTAILADKAIFILAQTYQFGIKNYQKASEIYQKLLEKFPNSLYFDRARDYLKDLKTKNG